MILNKGKKTKAPNYTNLFADLKKEVAKLDPVAFDENYLTIDGKPFNMAYGTGYKYLADAKRYIAAQAENDRAKGAVILKGRQVGATVLAAAASLYLTSSGLYGTEANKPPMRILHLFPTLAQMKKYSKDKLDPMIRNSQGDYIASRLLRGGKDGKGEAEDNQSEKPFIGENKLRVDAIGQNADRIRGLTQDGIFFDEVQDMTDNAVENALRILTAAQYGRKTHGIQLFFGTPKESGSKFWKLWNESDQQFYQLKCSGCEDHFFLYEYGKDTWKDIWISGYTVKCPKCGCHQDKRLAADNGRWMPTKDSAKSRYTGFHINVILDPRFTKEMIMDYDPKVNPNRSERAFKNETLGEFYSSGGLPLTMEDIVHNALDLTRGVSEGVRSESNKIYTLGIDWGAKALDNDDDKGLGQSFTVMTVMSIDATGTMTIENSFRLRNNDFSHRVKVVEELFKRYRIHTAAADYGFGQDVINFLQVDRGYKSKLLGCYNSGTLLKDLSFDPKYSKVTLNKDMLIEEIFSLIRRGKIKFPVQGSSWDHLLWLMKHCSSMETKMVLKNDNYVKKYIKGTAPNDGLMSIIYAYIAYKHIVTGGFSVRAGETPKHRYPTPVLAYAPNIKGK